jgi:PAS domain S-box-containing protein
MPKSCGGGGEHVALTWSITRSSEKHLTIEAQPVAALWLAAIVESSADAIIGKTLGGVITSWNWGAEQMYGYAAEEMVGCNVSVLVPPDRPDELPAMLARLAGGERVARFETQRLRKDGTVIVVEVSVSPIRDGTVIVGASTVARDVTDRKRAEAEMHDLQDQLHQAQRLESVGQLAGGIAHDFNNLLAAIMNYAALVSGGLMELTSRLDLGADVGVATMTADVVEITNVATRAALLTRQLLIFSHRDVIKPETLDLNVVVAEVENLLRQMIGEGVVLSTDLAANLPRTRMDRGQIEQVLMNLAVNARDAMPAGGTMRVATSGFRADDDYDGKHGVSGGVCVRLEVSDTGCGMLPDVAARAFEAFFTTKAKGKGSGLGLATVYGIVAQAGGEVTLDSEPGLGTTIRVDLPATPDDPATDARKDPPVIPSTSSGETILLVEDEDMVRVPAERMLISHGYRVLAASNADEALRIAREHAGDIALLLSDMVMPGQSGKDLAVQLTRLRPATRVLFMSGYSQDVIVEHGILEDGLDLIEKPFAAEDLLRRIRGILDAG